MSMRGSDTSTTLDMRDERVVACERPWRAREWRMARVVRRECRKV